MDPLQKISKLDFVRSQVAQYAGTKKSLSDSTMILCPYHSESTPSGRIFHSDSSYNPGFFSCYACGAKAKWDDLAPRLGLQPYKAGPPKDERATNLFMEKALEKLEAEDGYRQDRFKFWDLPRGKKWRTIPTELLIELGGRMCYKWSPHYEQWGSTKYIHFPVDINGDTKGFFLARLKKDTSDKKLPSYLLAAALSSSGWSKTHGLWPFDHSIKMMKALDSRTMVIVEGQRDALRLITNDVPAVCIFGTQGWSVNKSKLLEVAGVNKVLQLMDGDCAGKNATDLIHPQLESMFNAQSFRLWAITGSPYLKFKDFKDPTKAAKKAGVSLWDPANMPQRIVELIKHKYF